MTNHRIKVLHIIPSLVVGGAERHVLDLVKHMNNDKFNTRIISLYPYTGNHIEEEAKAIGLDVRYLNKHLGLDLNVIVDLTKEITNFQPHILHNHLYALYACIPAILFTHISVKLHTFHSLVDPQKTSIHERLIAFCIKHMGVAPIAISKQVAYSISQNLSLSDIKTIHNGIDTNLFTFNHKERMKIREELPLSHDDFLIITVARLSPEKNQAVLLRAAKTLYENGIKFHCVIVGDGPLRSDLEQKCSNFNLHDHVSFLGTRQDIPSLLSASDCFVLPSTREGLSLSLLEAMAIERPVIASAVGGIPDIVQNYENGILIEPSNVDDLVTTLINIKQAPEKYQEMGRKARQTVIRKYSIDTMAANYENYYLKKLTPKLDKKFS